MWAAFLLMNLLFADGADGREIVLKRRLVRVDDDDVHYPMIREVFEALVAPPLVSRKNPLLRISGHGVHGFPLLHHKRTPLVYPLLSYASK